MLVERKVQWIRGPGCCTKRSSWGWRWGRNQHAQLCSTAGRRDQDIALPNLGLTRKISSASRNYLSLELKNLWWTKALLQEHIWRWRNLLFHFAFCNLFWWSNRELVSSYNLHFQASVFCPFSKPFQNGTWFILILMSILGHLQLENTVVFLKMLSQSANWVSLPSSYLAQISSSSFLSPSLLFSPCFTKFHQNQFQF